MATPKEIRRYTWVLMREIYRHFQLNINKHVCGCLATVSSDHTVMVTPAPVDEFDDSAGTQSDDVSRYATMTDVLHVPLQVFFIDILDDLAITMKKNE